MSVGTFNNVVILRLCDSNRPKSCSRLDVVEFDEQKRRLLGSLTKVAVMPETAVTVSGTRLQNFLDRAGLRGFPWKTATILYTISWGWLLTVGNVNTLDEPLYWRTFIKLEDHGFAPWIDFLYTDFFDFLFPYFSEFVFVVYFIVGMCSFAIIRVLNLLDRSQVIFFTLLVLLVPFNTARVSSMTFVYTCSLLIFCIAWLLLITTELLVVKLLSLLLFFMSFATHSLVLFFALPLLQVYLTSQPKNLNSAIFWFRKNLILFLPPFLYVGLRAVFWAGGPNYHDVNSEKLLNGLQFSIPFLAIGVIVLVCNQSSRFRNLTGMNAIVFGLLASFLGSLPYLLYGFYQPDISFFRTFAVTFVGRSSWLSRHQLLQAFGLALILVGFVQLVSNLSTGFAKFLKITSIACCMFFSGCFGFEYVVDSQKQDRIIDALENESDLVMSRDYSFVDQVATLNSRGRPYKSSSYSVLLHQAKYRGDRKNLLTNFVPWNVSNDCRGTKDGTLVLTQGPETHWDALKNWVSDGDMGFKVTVDDTPGACRPEMVMNGKVSGAIPILFYFTGAKG